MVSHTWCKCRKEPRRPSARKLWVRFQSLFAWSLYSFLMTIQFLLVPLVVVVSLKPNFGQIRIDVLEKKNLPNHLCTHRATIDAHTWYSLSLSSKHCLIISPHTISLFPTILNTLTLSLFPTLLLTRYKKSVTGSDFFRLNSFFLAQHFALTVSIIVTEERWCQSKHHAM